MYLGSELFSIRDRSYFPPHPNSTLLTLTITLILTLTLTILTLTNPNPNHNHTLRMENSPEQIQLSVPVDGKYRLPVFRVMDRVRNTVRIWFLVIWVFGHHYLLTYLLTYLLVVVDVGLMKQSFKFPTLCTCPLLRTISHAQRSTDPFHICPQH